MNIDKWNELKNRFNAAKYLIKEMFASQKYYKAKEKFLKQQKNIVELSLIVVERKELHSYIARIAAKSKSNILKEFNAILSDITDRYLYEKSRKKEEHNHNQTRND